MCNLYMMFFTEPGKSGDFLACWGEQAGQFITRGLPADSDVAPPKNKVWEDKAKDSSVNTGISEINYSQVQFYLYPGGCSFRGGIQI